MLDDDQMLAGDADDVFMQNEMEDEEAIMQSQAKPKKATSTKVNSAAQRKASQPNIYSGQMK